jgi:perosamine synthetase
MTVLAINGGSKVITKTFDRYNTIGEEEKNAAMEVLDTGILSDYLATWGEKFSGGLKVNEFENNLADYFEVKHAICVNSWTSGLVSAVGALDIEPGDEIIVSPLTMSASATSIIHWNAIPVFADVENEYFCIDPKSIEKSISSRTKAILAVDIYGQSANMEEINVIAKKYDLKVISDSAQAIGAMYKGKYTGTHCDIGGYSLNRHKHIHTGEGGIIVTDSDFFAERMRLIRNHAELIVEDKGQEKINNMIGSNFRLGEIESSIGIHQLKKLTFFIKQRQNVAEKLNEGLKELKYLQTPLTRNHSTHVYYYYPLTLDTEALGVSRKTIIAALLAEGIQGITPGYQGVHLLPMFQNKIAYGHQGFPWSISSNNINYDKGICPVAEKLYGDTFMALQLCLFSLSDKDVDLIITAFHKVWDNLETLN